MEQSSKSVIVTGAGNGIGEETALEFARRGYRVGVSDIDSTAAATTAGKLRALGVDAFSMRCDVGQSADVRAFIDAAIGAFGRIDIAFNNAGISGGRKPVVDAEEAEFDACIQTNLKGTWLCMKYEIEHMLAAGGGAIINNCSIVGLNGSVGASYCASKHGVAGLTKSAALVYASQGVRVNAVCPGLIEAGLGKKLINRFGADSTKLYETIPAGRPGSALEVAKAVVWLASDDASFVHGHMLTVDGGYDSH